MSRSIIYTVGHSTLTIDAFVEEVRGVDVDMIVDIITVPRFRTNPQYNVETLPDTLAVHKIGYERIPELGGLRKKSATALVEANGFWQNPSFHNYSDTPSPSRLISLWTDWLS